MNARVRPFAVRERFTPWSILRRFVLLSARRGVIHVSSLSSLYHRSVMHLNSRSYATSAVVVVRLRRRNISETLLSGPILATLPPVTIQLNLPDELVARIDSVTRDRAAFVLEAVRSRLRESERNSDVDEIARINAVVDDLNREAEDVLEYQVIP